MTFVIENNYLSRTYLKSISGNSGKVLMAYFRLVLFAAKFNRIYKKLKIEKDAALSISRGEKPKYGLKSKIAHLKINCRRKILKCLISMYFLRNTALDRFFYRLRKYGSFENYILKSIFGFLSGYFLTYLLFLFLTVQLNVNLTLATLVCCVIGCILTLGLAFSEKVRCIVLLTLPQFFSKRGRQALIAYALILTLTGPTKNILNNMGIMSESLACGQEQLKSAVRQILDVIKKPFVAIKDAIKAVVKAVKEIIKKIKDILIKIKRVIMAILDVIKAVFQFLGKILSICNKELGTPFERCSRVFETAVTDCQASLGPWFGWACSIGYLLSTVCYIVKPFDLICMLVDFISNSIIGVVVRKVKIFIRHVKTMFYVRIKFSHSFHFQSNSSKSMREVAEGIVGEVKTRTRGIVSVVQFFNCAASLFFIFLIFRVISYRHNFLTKERFDNRFLTRNLADIDLRRAAMDKETILPLNHRERKRYVTTTSLRLIEPEKKHLSEGMSFLMSTAIKIGIQMGLDYSLYWIMMLIRKYGKFQSKVQTPNIPTIHIAGNGLLADLLKGIVKSFQPLGISLEIDTVPCLPAPLPPNTDRYIQIASILLVCFFFTIFEPYGLRWRHSVLCYYYPKRARERAIWLYNHILRSRSSFLKFARRQLRRKVLGSKKIAKVTCREFLRSKTNNKCLLFFLGSDKQRACLFCGEIFRESDKEEPIECQRPGCTAIYCRQCFEDLENVCTVCMAPIEYGDNSDMSEEKDSSDEDFTITDLTLSDEDDSGRSSQEEGSSTDDLSYGYQEVEKQASQLSDFKTRSSRDLEKQHIPDYASMQTFDDDSDSHLSQIDSDEDFTDTQTPVDSSQSFSSATSFRRAKADYERSLRGRLPRKCPCLTLDELNLLASGISLEDRNRRSSIESSYPTNAGNNSSEFVGDLHDFEAKEEELLIEFSSDDESEEDKSLEERRKKISSRTSTSEKEATYKSGELLSDSELSDEDVAELTGKPNPKFNKATSADFEDTHDKGSNESSSTLSPSSRNNVNSSPISSSETTGRYSSPTSREYDVASLIPESDSSVTELKRQEKLSDRRDSFRHIEFIGIDKRKSSPSDSSLNEKSHQNVATDKIYRSTVATKTSIDDVSNQKKERKKILKINSDSSAISDVVTVGNDVTIPKLNLTSLKSRSPISTTNDTGQLSTDNQNKRTFDVNYKVESETPTRKKIADTRKGRQQNTNRRLKGGTNLANKKSSMSIYVDEEFPPDETRSFDSTNNHSNDEEYFSSPTYPFKSDCLITPSRSQDLSSTFASPKTIKDPRFFESSDSSLTLNFINKDSLDEAEDISSEYTFSSMPAKNRSSKSKSNKTRRSVKSDVNTSDKNVVRITASSEETKTKPQADVQVETDASSELSVSVQENILGVPKRKKRGKQAQKPENEVQKPIPEVNRKSEQRKKGTVPVSDDENEDKQDTSRKSEETIKRPTRVNDKKAERRDEQKEELSTSKNKKAEGRNEGDSMSRQTSTPPKKINSESYDKKAEKLEEAKERTNNKKSARKSESETNSIKPTRNSRSNDKKNKRFNEIGEKNPILEEASETQTEEETEEEDISDKTESNTESEPEKVSTTLLVTPKASILSKKRSDEGRNSGTLSPKGNVIIRDRPRVYDPMENECGCCVCRHRFPKIRCATDRYMFVQPSIDSCTQTNFEMSERCCQIDRTPSEPDIVHCRCFDKNYTSQCKQKEEPRCFCPKIQFNENCFCEVCTRLMENQDRHLLDDRDICCRNTIITSKRSKMPSEYPTTSMEHYDCSKKTIGTVCKPHMRNQASFVKQTSQKNTCRVSFPEEESDVSLYSDSGRYRDIVELPYQDSDEYTKLMRELEDRLVARNRERVRRTIKQFEECSSRNQNLRKPILYDGSSCGEEPILSELAHLKSGDCNIRSCDSAGRPPPVSCLKNQIRGMKTTVESMARYLDPNQSERLQRYPRVKEITDPTRWYLDHRTGEWFRITTGNMGDAYNLYEPERVCTSPDVSPRRRMLGRYDDGSRCEECDELNRRYGHRFHILCCPRHRSDNVASHRKT